MGRVVPWLLNPTILLLSLQLVFCFCCFTLCYTHEVCCFASNTQLRTRVFFLCIFFRFVTFSTALNNTYSALNNTYPFYAL